MALKGEFLTYKSAYDMYGVKTQHWPINTVTDFMTWTLGYVSLGSVSTEVYRYMLT